MKLDATDLRFLSTDEFRVLTAVEMGSKNHEIVPSSLIASISGLRSGGVMKCLGELAKRTLVARVKGAKYDGFRLTYGGYDYLAIRAFAKRDTVYSVGNQIGTGKESDIYVVADEEGNQNVLKIHRLGRISFRTIKSKRDYLRRGQHASWMYMSRLAATKEFAFMKVLHEHGFPVPKPIDQARHCVVMSLIDAFPLRQVSEIADPGALYSQLMDLIVRLAKAGLIHGDFNEFNILLTDAGAPILIDFPQMISTEHENAEFYFNRDVACIRTFFKRRFRYESATYPRFRAAVEGEREFRLDVIVEASGWSHGEARQLSEYFEMLTAEGDEQPDSEMDCEDEIVELAVEPTTDDAASKFASQHDDEDDEDEDEDEDNDDRQLPSEETEAAEDPDLNPLSLQGHRDVSAQVASEMAKQRASQARRHHGRKGSHTPGRRKGSKAKSDSRLAAEDGW